MGEWVEGMRREQSCTVLMMSKAEVLFWLALLDWRTMTATIQKMFVQQENYIEESDIARLIAFRNNPSDESWIGGNA